MTNYDKIKFFQQLGQLQEIKRIEQSLQDNPIYEDELSEMGYDLVSKNSDLVKDLRKRGLIIPRPYPTIQEFVAQATGYVVKRSTLLQMEKSEYRQIRDMLANRTIETYDDLDNGTVPLHFQWQKETLNGFETNYTGGTDMVNVVREVLDIDESRAKSQTIRQVQDNYKEARQEIDFLLNNIEAIQQGMVATQYHDSIGR